MAALLYVRIATIKIAVQISINKLINWRKCLPTKECFIIIDSRTHIREDKLPRSCKKFDRQANKGKVFITVSIIEEHLKSWSSFRLMKRSVNFDSSIQQLKLGIWNYAALNNEYAGIWTYFSTLEILSWLFHYYYPKIAFELRKLEGNNYHIGYFHLNRTEIKLNRLAMHSKYLTSSEKKWIFFLFTSSIRPS